MTSEARLPLNSQYWTKSLSFHDSGLSGQLNFDWPDWKPLGLNYSNGEHSCGSWFCCVVQKLVTQDLCESNLIGSVHKWFIYINISTFMSVLPSSVCRLSLCRRPVPTSEFHHENSSILVYNVILCRPPEELDSTRVAATF